MCDPFLTGMYESIKTCFKSIPHLHFSNKNIIRVSSTNSRVQNVIELIGEKLRNVSVCLCMACSFFM